MPASSGFGRALLSRSIVLAQDEEDCMRFAAWLFTWSAACVLFSGCGSKTPSSPSASTSPVSIRSITPASGTTLVVRDCGFDGLTVICTQEPRLSVDIDVPRDIGDPALDATLEGASKRCASFGAIQPRITRPLRAGRYSFEFTEIYLFATGPNHEQDCPFPAETTRLVIRLWDVTGAAIPREVLTKEFPHTYRFEKR
jgi:hypothetical protein